VAPRPARRPLTSVERRRTSAISQPGFTSVSNIFLGGASEINRDQCRGWTGCRGEGKCELLEHSGAAKIAKRHMNPNAGLRHINSYAGFL